MEIKSNIRNELFKRDEIIFLLDAEKTPSFDEMEKKVLEQVKKPKENIDVYSIKGNFGLKQFNIGAYVYDSKEDLEKAEQKTQKQRKQELEKTEKKEETEIKDKEKSTEEKTKTKETPANVLVEEKKQEIKEQPLNDKPKEESKG